MAERSCGQVVHLNHLSTKHYHIPGSQMIISLLYFIIEHLRLFFKKNWRTWVLLWGHWYPCFRLLVMFPLGSKPDGQPYLYLAEVYMLHVPWDSPLVRHLLTSWQPAWQPSRLFHIPVIHWWDLKLRAIMPPLTVWDQADALPTLRVIVTDRGTQLILCGR